MSVRLIGAAVFALTAGTAFGADEPAVVKLPAPAVRSTTAGAGRFLALHLPQAKQVALYDVKDGKVAKLLPAPDDDLLLAGGRDYLFVIRRSNNTMQRWSLATFEKEATVQLPVGVVIEGAHIGAGANGPLFLAPKGGWRYGGKPLLLNPITGRDAPTTGWLPEATGAVHVSPDGKVFAWPTGIRQIAVMRVTDGKFAAKTYPLDTYQPHPGPGGRYFYTLSAVHDEDARQVHPKPGAPRGGGLLPADHGPFFMETEFVARAPGAGSPFATGAPSFAKAHVYFEGQFKPVATLHDLDRHERSHSYPRLFPRYGRLILQAKDDDALIVYSFDLDALLAKSDVEFLAVVSDPPQEAVAGRPFEYTPVVKSKKGGVKVSLDAGPDGMKLGADGKLTWDVPAALAGQEAVVILSVSDASGRDLFHTLRLAVTAAAKP